MYPTGAMMPVRELCTLAREHGVLSSVDGAHPVGMVDIDLRAMGCDHYAGAGQKWLLAGTGTGIAYVRSDLQDRIWPDCWVAEEEKGNTSRARASTTSADSGTRLRRWPSAPRSSCSRPSACRTSNRGSVR